MCMCMRDGHRSTLGLQEKTESQVGFLHFWHDQAVPDSSVTHGGPTKTLRGREAGFFFIFFYEGSKRQSIC